MSHCCLYILVHFQFPLQSCTFWIKQSMHLYVLLFTLDLLSSESLLRASSELSTLRDWHNPWEELEKLILQIWYFWWQIDILILHVCGMYLLWFEFNLSTLKQSTKEISLSNPPKLVKACSCLLFLAYSFLLLPDQLLIKSIPNPFF